MNLVTGKSYPKQTAYLYTTEDGDQSEVECLIPEDKKVKVIPEDLVLCNTGEKFMGILRLLLSITAKPLCRQISGSNTERGDLPKNPKYKPKTKIKLKPSKKLTAKNLSSLQRRIKQAKKGISRREDEIMLARDAMQYEIKKLLKDRKTMTITFLDYRSALEDRRNTVYHIFFNQNNTFSNIVGEDEWVKEQIDSLDSEVNRLRQELKNLDKDEELRKLITDLKTWKLIFGNALYAAEVNNIRETKS